MFGQERRFVTCRTVDALHSLIKPSLEAIVCGPGFGVCNRSRTLETIDQHAIILVFRLALTEDDLVEFVALVRELPHIRMSLRTAASDDCFIPDLAAVLCERDEGPIGVTVSRIAGKLSVDAQRLVVAALAVGRTRVDVATYARICGSAPRSIQRATQRAGLPSPHRLLLWGQALWMAWRMERAKMSCKQAAVAGGFGTASSLAATLRPVTRTTPTSANRSGGFGQLLLRFEEELESRSSTCNPPGTARDDQDGWCEPSSTHVA
jgi:hypothetical protein